MSSYTTSSVIFTSKDIVQNGFNNVLELTLGGSAVDLNNSEVALAKLSMYNSVFNINGSIYGNNTFQILLPYNVSGALTWHTLTITLPPGSYNYSDINTFIQSQLITLGFYLINNTGQYVYPIRISSNSVQYACQFDLSQTNSTLPSGWSFATSGFWSNSSGLPSTGPTPRIVITTSMSEVFGISPGTYPSVISTTNTSVLSNFTPQINPVQSYFLRCSLVNNPFTPAAPDVLTSFTDGDTSIGDQISVDPPEYSWVSIPNQSVSKITLTITDQDFRFVRLQDPKVVIQLLIKQYK